MVAVIELVFILSIALALLLLISVLVLLGITWTHYPYGVRGRRKKWQRKSRTSATTKEK